MLHLVLHLRDSILQIGLCLNQPLGVGLFKEELRQHLMYKIQLTYCLPTGGLKDVTLTVTNSRGSHTATFQVNVPIVGTATFPFAENFEGPVFPPLGWETINRNGNPAINWDVRNGYSGYGIGNRSMIYDNTSLDGRFFKDDIQTPKINLTGVTEAKLKFDIAYAPFFGDAVVE
jgi:hypothetical protein